MFYFSRYITNYIGTLPATAVYSDGVHTVGTENAVILEARQRRRGNTRGGSAGAMGRVSCFVKEKKKYVFSR